LGNRQVRLTWQSGTGQAALRLIRDTEHATSAVSLTSTDTAYTDALPIGTNRVCYQLLALNQAGLAIQRSFAQCFIPFGGYAMGFAMRYDPLVAPPELCPCPPPPEAIISWSPVPSAAAYALLPLWTTRLQVLPADSTGTVDSPGAQTVCYVAAPVNSSGLMGLSDILCGAPFGS